jgi:hypothetical protein
MKMGAEAAFAFLGCLIVRLYTIGLSRMHINRPLSSETHLDWPCPYVLYAA